jgi:uncharacterized lipoprotein YmbA
VRYFALNPIDAEYCQDPDDAVILGLGPLRIPDYLDRSQIVTRNLDAEVQVIEFNREVVSKVETLLANQALTGQTGELPSPSLSGFYRLPCVLSPASIVVKVTVTLCS